MKWFFGKPQVAGWYFYRGRLKDGSWSKPFTPMWLEADDGTIYGDENWQYAGPFYPPEDEVV